MDSLKYYFGNAIYVVHCSHVMIFCFILQLVRYFITQLVVNNTSTYLIFDNNIITFEPLVQPYYVRIFTYNISDLIFGWSKNASDFYQSISVILYV